MGGGTPAADRKAGLEYDSRLAEAIAARWSALCEHYRTTEPEIVAIKLALDHVPGFQVKPKKSRGRKPK
jgi:hypothetical protein